MITITLLIVLSSFFCKTQASVGDNSLYYQRCTEQCSQHNCTADGLNFLHDVFSYQSAFLSLLRWTCVDECQYDCMWKTVNTYEKRKWPIPQFYGKWPFLRISGFQEPASTLFSLLNLYVQYRMFKNFKRLVNPDSPLYWLWHVFCAVCMHAWFWSAVFHSRDLPFTEFMDYSCAFSMVLINLYCMMIRLFHKTSKFMKTVISSCHLVFFINHVGYLSQGIEYGYNMKINVAVGTLTAIGWFAWCVWNRRQQPYTWKCAAFVTLAGVCMILEIFDFPPIFWIFDSHAIWHFSTAIITPIFYSFIIDDCKYLHRLQYEPLKEEKKMKD